MRDHDDDRDYGESKHSARVEMPKSVEEMRHQFESQYKKNLNSLGSISLETDEKGNATIMGISVPKELKPAIEVGIESIKPYIIDQSHNIFNNAKKLADKISFTKAHSTKIGIVAENVFRWGIIGAKPLFDAVNASSKYSKERRELFNTFSPVMQSTGSNAHSNEVFRTAFNDVHSDWLSDMKKMVADLPTLVPMAILGLQDQAMAAKKRATGLVGHHKADDVIAKTVDENIDKKMAYATRQLEESQLIARKMEEARENWVKKELEKNATRIVDPHDAYLLKPGSRKTDDYVFDQPTRDLIEKGKPIKVGRDYLVSKFNENAPSPRDVMRSLQEHEEYGQKRNNHDEEVKKDEAKEKTDKMLKWAIPGASILTQIFKANIEDSSEKRKKRVKAWKMIEHLKKEMEVECGKINGHDSGDCDRSFTSKSADDIRVEGMGNKDGEKVSLKEFIIDVFQQHERDREPSRNFRDKNGKLIDPLKGTLLANLEPAIDLIADRIADGSLSADALYKLVGENKVIMHGKSGAKAFAKEDQVRQVIEKELLPVLSTREVVKLEEFMAKFADPALIQTTLKKNLEGMKGTEKALFASLFPDDILEQAGLKKKDIVALRKEAHQFSYDFIAASVIHFSKKNPDALKELGVSEQEIAAINGLAEKIESGDMKALKTAVDGRNKEAIDAVRTAGLLEQAKSGEQGKTYWTDRVKEMGAVHQKLKENEKKFAEESEDRGEGKKRGRDDSNDDDKKWSSEKKSKRQSKSNRDWDGDNEDRSSEREHSSRFDPGRNKDSARDRVRKGRSGSEDSHDMRVV